MAHPSVLPGIWLYPGSSPQPGSFGQSTEQSFSSAMSWESCSIPENIVSLTTKLGCHSTASDVRLYGHNQFANQSLWSLALILQVWPPQVLRYDSMMWGCRVSSQVCLPWSWELTTITTYFRVVSQRRSDCLVLWSNMVDYRLVNSYSWKREPNFIHYPDS